MTQQVQYWWEKFNVSRGDMEPNHIIEDYLKYE